MLSEHFPLLLSSHFFLLCREVFCVLAGKTKLTVQSGHYLLSDSLLKWLIFQHIQHKRNAISRGGDNHFCINTERDDGKKEKSLPQEVSVSPAPAFKHNNNKLGGCGLPCGRWAFTAHFALCSSTFDDTGRVGTNVKYPIGRTLTKCACRLRIGQ